MKHSFSSFLLLCVLCIFPVFTQAAEPLRVVAFGDSLIAGYGLPAGQDYASRLEAALKSEENLNVKIENAGVSGDTTAGGVIRLDQAIAGAIPPRLVIVALGGNDLLRGVPPQETEDNLRIILQKLQQQKIPAVLYGMRTPMGLPALYRKPFDRIYTKLAREFDVPLYPFFLDGVALRSDLNQPDGVHPNEQGVAIMVDKTMPLIRKILDD